MTAPNMVNITSMVGKTITRNIATTVSSFLTNSASSNKVFKINTIIVQNVDGTNAATVNLYLNRALDPALGDLQIAKTISVPANSNLVLISKDTSFYMEEGDILKGNTAVNGDLTLLVSYEEIE
jgi:hypothetical protein